MRRLSILAGLFLLALGSGCFEPPSVYDDCGGLAVHDIPPWCS